ncbi:MAG TPA: bifunctional adenosylcobinamide kinase/adenosylcobinamide-phosphate guanylyltransferase [Pseudonocardiaceae bacterium]|nr:bifunctional adenosylcobinamide kinase/adenosylcobinamide-phosphate guanylyltransferase [Pseudonocardiaceae bacterium]
MTLRTLVLGGARSGKSAHAEGLVSPTGPVSYLATGRRDPTDPEWSARIAAHVARRPAHWDTIEITDAALLAELISDAFDADPTLLVDDLATWLTGLLDEVRGWDGRKSALRLADTYLDKLVAAVTTTRARLVLVSSEVGLGVVPATPSGRLFRDLLGTLNARLADECDEVLLLVAGIPMQLKKNPRHKAPRR